jgi:hypothetical protein
VDHHESSHHHIIGNEVKDYCSGGGGDGDGLGYRLPIIIADATLGESWCGLWYWM